MRPLRLSVVPGEFTVWRLAVDAPIPEVEAGAFSSMTRTDHELSIVSVSDRVPEGVDSEPGWRCLQVEGPLPFEMTGVLADLSRPLADAGIPIFVVSTFATDYLLVKGGELDRACSALAGAGYRISMPR